MAIYLLFTVFLPYFFQNYVIKSDAQKSLAEMKVVLCIKNVCAFIFLTSFIALYLVRKGFFPGAIFSA